VFQRLIENTSVHNSKGSLRVGLTWLYIMRGDSERFVRIPQSSSRDSRLDAAGFEVTKIIYIDTLGFFAAFIARIFGYKKSADLKDKKM